MTVSSWSQIEASGRASEEMVRSGDVPALAVEWDRAEGLFWTLRLCEYFGAREARWDYPPPAVWVASEEARLGYTNHPVSRDRSIPGRADASAQWQSDTLSFEVVLHNDASTVWEDAWTWVCLIHRWAGSFQANCELPVGPGESPWAACTSLNAPLGRWLKWCPVRARRQVAERIGRGQAHLWQPHIEADRGAVRAWRMDLERPLQQRIELSSDDAVILGWSHWPCTDIGLCFGDIRPGRSATVRGQLRFCEIPYTPV